jgi:hypothetical protein
MQRGLILTAAALCIFDYMVIGSVSTLVSLLLLFLVWASTSMKSNLFFKKRRK